MYIIIYLYVTIYTIFLTILFSSIYYIYVIEHDRFCYLFKINSRRSMTQNNHHRLRFISLFADINDVAKSQPNF